MLRRVLKPILYWMGFLFVVLTVSMVGFVWYEYHQLHDFWRGRLPSFEQVHLSYIPSDQPVLDRRGIQLGVLRTNPTERRLAWVSQDKVSPVFLEQLIQTEDQRFDDHRGVDWKAISKATWRWLFVKDRSRGASTITMQLVGMLQKQNRGYFGGIRYVSGRRGVEEKFQQMIAALVLEESWSKAQILEAYLNLVPFRGELVGIHAASIGLFDKGPQALDPRESAVLIALLRAPNAKLEKVADRGCGVLMKYLPSENCQNFQAWVFKELSIPHRIANLRDLIPVLSPNMLDLNPSEVAREKTFGLSGLGKPIWTTVDYAVQKLAVESLREQISLLGDQHVSDGAVLVLDNKTGRVVAYVANMSLGRQGKISQVDGIQMRRQAGSTLKPFIYATALDMQVLTPESLVDDSPLDISVGQGLVYQPSNYDKQFKGVVPIREALASSLNIPAVKVLSLVGEDEVLRRMRRLGFSDLQEDDFYGPSLALGTVDVSLWDLTHAYRLLGQKKQKSVFSPRVSQVIFDMLSAPENRHWTFGFYNTLTLPFPAAVKTGTSKDMRDNWCIGWTDRYTVGVWVGNFDGASMWQVSGVSGAAPIWRRLMLALHPDQANQVSKNMTFSQSVPLSTRLNTTAASSSGTDGMGELPLAQAKREVLIQKTISRIRYPVNGSIVAIDPEIPSDVQSLSIEIDAPQKGHELWIDGQYFSPSQRVVFFPLTKVGKYRLELKSPEKTVDSLLFEVR